MLVRPRDFEATLEDPFANDRLGRREHVKAVCRAIAEMEGPAVVALDGGWGTGKTAFLAMCTAWLQSEFEIPVVGFNAWSQSHTQMPLVDLVSALTAEGKPAARPLRERVAAVGWHLAKFGTRGLVDRDVIAEVMVSEGSWDTAEKETAEFKRQLQIWAEASGPRGLVVCVDELDRCRPEYALSLLEVIRQLFDVSGVVVLLATNRNELAHSVKSIFGGDFNADRYLRRIVDRTVQLPAPRHFDLQQFLGRLMADVGLAAQISRQARPEVQEMLFAVASPPGSLRDVQQAAVLAAMAGAAIRGRDEFLSAMAARSLVALIALRIHAPEVYEELTSGKTNAVAAIARLSGAWPSDPSLGQSFDTERLNHAKRHAEALIVMMGKDPTERLSVPVGFIERYTAAGGEATTGNMVAAEIKRWASDPSVRVPSLSTIAQSIELFAQ